MARSAAKGEAGGCPRSGRRAEQFLRRFRRHLLPRGFTKVRHYGLLANNTRKALIPQTRAAIAAGGGGRKKPQPPPPKQPDAPEWPPPCARCGATHQRCVALVRPDGHRVKIRPPRCERASEPP